MQRIFAPLLLSLPLIFGCIPDLPDLYDENFTCQWDDDCQQEDEAISSVTNGSKDWPKVATETT